MSDVPLCPVTGEPARRLVQWVNVRFLTELWRIEMGVDVRPSFGDVPRFGLWESPTGLHFFDPMVEGDAGFYESFYARLYGEPKGWLGLLGRRLLPRAVASGDGIRPEFTLAARHAKPGDRVLDVGCGPAVFRRTLPAVRYTGLDPHLTDATRDPDLRRETLEAHLETHAGEYDLVASFQVLEYVRDPLAFLRRIVEAARPGGLVAIGVPQVPSAHSRIPNNLINAVPHHLTWWTKPALEAIAVRAGLVAPQVETVPWGEIDALLYWMDRCSPVTCTERHYRHAWTWHAATLVSIVGALVMCRLRSVPEPSPDDEGGGLLLVARKPE